MTKEVRLLWLVLAFAAIVTSSACRHRPAYSDIDANKAASSRNSNTEGKSSEASPTAGLPPMGAGQPAGAPPSAPKFQTPAFLDQATGGIKDLPNYPRSSRGSIQIGPNQGFNVMSLMLQTVDSMDQIAAFYQKAIKENHWTVIAEVVDPEKSEWALKKGDENTATIQVKKDPATSRRNIFVVRGVKLDEASK